MEPTGLTLGAIALASLFTECIQCLDLIELARSSEQGLKTQVCKLSLIKRQFMVWGESIGLLSPDEGRDDVLDQVQGRQEIEDVLQQISILLKDAEKLKTKYGVDVDSMDGRQSDRIEVSRSRRDIFKQNPLVEFISRLAAHQRKSTILSKTRWAIRDSKKFEILVKDLDWFVTKLITIDVSHETHIRREMAIREDVQSIVDLSTLSIMEQTCTGPNRSWATAARIHSDYLSSAGSSVDRDGRIRDWNAHLESTTSDSQSMSVDEMTRKKRRYEALSPSLSTSSSIRPDSPPLPIAKNPNAPDNFTQVYIYCCQELLLQDDKRKNMVLSEDILLILANSLGDPYELPDMSAYHNAREKVISKVKDNANFRFRYKIRDGEYKQTVDGKTRTKIHVFCPPLLQYILFALALASPDGCIKTWEFQLVIHPDDRLFDADLYSAEERHESLLQLDKFLRLHAEFLDPVDATLGEVHITRWRFLATQFDQVWLDQRITASASYKRTGDKIDVSEFFKESKEAHEVALMVIMAGPQICNDITRTAPLAGPDNPVQPSQIYRLEELAGVDDVSLFRWKTRYFCRIHSPQEVEERKRRDRNAVLSRMGR